MRELRLLDVQERLDRFETILDPDIVLAPDCIGELGALLAAVPDPYADIEVSTTAGRLHWYRSQLLDADEAHEDLIAAVAFFVPVHREYPEAVPDKIRETLDSPGTTADLAAHILRVALRTRDRTAVATVVELLRKAVMANPDDRADRVAMLCDLCTALEARCRMGESLALRRSDADAAVQAGRDAVEAATSDHPDRSTCLSNLAVALRTRFDLEREPADLDEAVDTARLAVETAAGGDPNRAGYLSNLGGVLSTRYDITGKQDDLDRMIESHRAAAEATAASDSERARVLANLASSLLRRSRLSMLPSDFDEAVAVARRAVAASPPESPVQAGCLSALGNTLRARFEVTGRQEDIDEAVQMDHRAVAAVPAENPDYLSNLGYALSSRFEKTGQSADLDDAIGFHRRAVAADSTPHPGHLSNLGLALWNRFRLTGSQANLAEAVDIHRQAVAASQESSPDHAGFLSNLSLALSDRFRWTGRIEDLDDAIDAGRQTVAVATADRSHLHRYLANLGTLLHHRFRATSAEVDIDDAAEIAAAAVRATPEGHPERAGHLSNLGSALSARFDRTGRREDLDDAIEAFRCAAAERSGNYSDLPRILSNLGAALHSRFRLEDPPLDEGDLDEVVELSRRAVAASPVDGPDRAGHLANLSSVLRTRSERTWASADLDEAIDVGQQAVAATPAHHPELAVNRSILGNAFETRFGRAHSPGDLAAGLAQFREAATMTIASPSARATASGRWAMLAGSAGDWAQAGEACAVCVAMLDRVAPRTSSRTDQEHALVQIAGLASMAAACYLQLGHPERALELWEQGRGVLLGQSLDLRTDLTSLSQLHPDLAARFTLLRDQLDDVVDGRLERLALPTEMTPGGMAPGPNNLATASPHEIDSRRRRRIVDEFDRVVTEIRSIPDFHRFLLPPSATALIPVAGDAAIVVINVSNIRSDALALTSSGIEVVPLPGLTPDAVADQVLKLTRLLAGTDDQVDRAIFDVLEWLWDGVAGPVLERLEIIGSPAAGQPWPRVWWCPTGLLSFLPIHAAGYHGTRSGSNPQTVLDRVVSSYTPTLRSLESALRRPAPVAEPRPDTEVLVVAMAATPAAPDLPGAAAESALLLRRFGPRARVLDSTQASRDTVLEALRQARVAHFACHGVGDIDDPSASRLLLQDYEVRPLTVVDVARLRLQDADLAFLSACSTAQPGAMLADEAIHLSSAFQLAGYREVVATLWPIGDYAALKIADDFYTSIASGREVGTTAFALHRAIRDLRKIYPDQPSSWASHIHSGA